MKYGIKNCGAGTLAEGVVGTHRSHPARLAKIFNPLGYDGCSCSKRYHSAARKRRCQSATALPCKVAAAASGGLKRQSSLSLGYFRKGPQAVARLFLPPSMSNTPLMASGVHTRPTKPSTIGTTTPSWVPCEMQADTFRRAGCEHMVIKKLD